MTPKFKQHALGYIVVRTKPRAKFRRITRREALRYFPLIFETVRNFDLKTFNRVYKFNEKPIKEGIYDGVFAYLGGEHS